MTQETIERPKYDTEAFRKARSGRNIALGLGLVARDRCTKVSFIVGKIATRGVC